LLRAPSLEAGHGATCSEDSERQPVHGTSPIALASHIHQRREAAGQRDAINGLEAEQEALDGNEVDARASAQPLLGVQEQLGPRSR
jgi:hypothetical protein